MTDQTFAGGAADPSALYDYPTEPVPAGERRGWLNLSFVTAGLAIAMSTLYTGAALATMLTLGEAIVAIAGGGLFLLVMAGLMGAIGARTGVTFSVLSRHAFGRFGSKLVGLIWAISLTGWYAYQCGFFGQTINIIFPDAALTQVTVATVWGGLLMMTTAIVGFRALAVLSAIATPVILLMCLWGMGLAFAQVGWSDLDAVAPANPASLGVGITVVIGGWIVGAIMQPDVARYVVNGRQNWVACALAMVAFAIATFAGMVMTKAAGAETIMHAMVALGMGAASLFMVILAQWTSNDNNLYSASLGVANIRAFPKWRIAIVLGLVATAIAFFGVTDFFVPFLVFLGTFIPPIGGIIAVDYYLLGKREAYRFDPSTRYRQVNAIAIVTVIAAGAIASQIGWGIGPVNSFVVGGIIYFAAMKLADSLGMNPYVGDEVTHAAS
jgi:cytosine permease